MDFYFILIYWLFKKKKKKTSSGIRINAPYYLEAKARKDLGLKILAMQVGGQHDVLRQRTRPLMDCPPNSFNVPRK